MAPLTDAMGLVDGDARELALGVYRRQMLTKGRSEGIFRGYIEESRQRVPCEVFSTPRKDKFTRLKGDLSWKTARRTHHISNH